jgi:hypothetical protein
LPDVYGQGQLDDGQAVVLTILPDRVVLRHKASVQKQVEKLLKDSGVASAVPRVSGGMAGRGGYGYGGYGGGESGRGGYGMGYRGGRFGGEEMEELYGGYGGEVAQPQPAEAD